MNKVERKLHTIDATEKAIGRIATEIANLLRVSISQNMKRI